MTSLLFCQLIYDAIVASADADQKILEGRENFKLFVCCRGLVGEAE
jgi:hypothetical protein